MTEVNVTKTIQIPAEAAWEKISVFSGIEDFSPIERSVVEGSGVGAKRTCYLPDGAEINETIVKLDHENMELQYDIVSGPFPFTDYLGTVIVRTVTDASCEVSWGSTFEVSAEAEQEMKGVLNGFYVAMIDGLETLIGAEA